MLNSKKDKGSVKSVIAQDNPGRKTAKGATKKMETRKNIFVKPALNFDERLKSTNG